MKLLIIILLLPVMIYSQELDAKVTVNFEKLPSVNRDLLAGFATAIEDYLNKNRFTDQQWDYPKIKCNFNIFFTNATDETNYSAQVNITSIRPVEKSRNASPMLNILDNSWTFTFQRGQSMNYNPSLFDPLTSFLNFYAYLIIGYDFDSYNPLSGTPFYERALNISALGQSSSNSLGWDRTSSVYNRKAIIEDLLNEKYRAFREGFFEYHYNGLDLYTTDKNLAQENMAKLVRNLDGIRSRIDVRGVLLRVFFDTKSGEIINYLDDYQGKIDVFNALKRVDPTHLAKYDEALNE